MPSVHTRQTNIPFLTILIIKILQTTLLGTPKQKMPWRLMPTLRIIQIIGTSLRFAGLDTQMPILGTSAMINHFTIPPEETIAAFLRRVEQMSGQCIPRRGIDKVIGANAGTSE
jgi:hypothetical protein